ncbi:MAG: DUF2784 domain-containing protein [Acidimicrobiia bacterium]|nr:DUF2784 domain-containing protein [Acidimicrobiia bacterium]
MPYAFLADAVVVLHLGYVVFVAVGGFIAWRYPFVLLAHVPAVGWALGIVTVGWPCPLTGVENDLREHAGSQAYEGGFIDRYLTGVLYPTQYERFMQALVAAGVITAYVRLAVRWRRSRRRRAKAGDLAPQVR